MSTKVCRTRYEYQGTTERRRTTDNPKLGSICKLKHIVFHLECQQLQKITKSGSIKARDQHQILTNLKFGSIFNF